MFGFFKNKKVSVNEPSHIPRTIEDITYVRNLQEKLASLDVGQTFALATRTGMHLFKKTSIQPSENVKDKSKEKHA